MLFLCIVILWTLFCVQLLIAYFFTCISIASWSYFSLTLNYLYAMSSVRVLTLPTGCLMWDASNRNQSLHLLRRNFKVWSYLFIILRKFLNFNILYYSLIFKRFPSMSISFRCYDDKFDVFLLIDLFSKIFFYICPYILL